MIDFLKNSFTRGWNLLHIHRQFVYTLLLLLIIPTAFLFSGQQFLNVAREHYDRAEKDRIGLLHDIFVSYLEETHGNIEGARRMAVRLGALNPDLSVFSVLQYQDQKFTTDPFIGESIDSRRYENELRAAGIRTDESLIFEGYENGKHVWIGVRAMNIGSASANYFLLTVLDISASDALYAHRVLIAYAYLAGIIFLIALLIIRHARIINYAELYEKLKEALVAKTTFITMTAHELRAPLTAMRGYASMIRESTEVSKETQERASRIEESSAYMVHLVSDMLDVAKIESGTMTLLKESVSVKEVIENLMTRLGSLGAEHNVTLQTEPMAEDVHIMVDHTRFEQILTNLISNAIKYTTEGTVTLAVSVAHNTCEIRIKDTGSGMNAEDQHKLFSPYFRTEDAETSGVTGTGLGMWITKQFIEVMGGSVDVESIHGVGTHVVVIFPLAKT